ncbi:MULTISPECIES: hypothetical protein [Variovorax]|uniref:hypothetical protein n=2 Tax=Comamonadaceae TaxID=80864 RepID=UPI001F4562F8|nr:MULTISPECIES: hypothetical protein [Variovorax]UKI12021.1 hypothetical protein L3V85_19660 [Variovorax paradoxus]
MAIIAVVATVFTAGVASIAIGAAQGGIGAALSSAGLGGIMTAGGSALMGGSIGAAIIGGAAGSIASQAVGIAIGAQDSFSWRGVALGALGAGVGAGVASWLSGGGAGAWLAGNGGDLAAAGRIAIGNIASQGLNIATGLQKGFDWRGVAASAASGFVSASAGDWAKGANWDLAGQRLVGTMAGGLMSAAVRGGSIGRALPGVIGDAVGAAVTVGNALGDSLAAANSSSSSTYVGPEEKLRDDFWAQTLGPVETRNGPPSQIDLFGTAPPAGGGLKLGGGLGLSVSTSTVQAWNDDMQMSIGVAAKRLEIEGVDSAVGAHSAIPKWSAEEFSDGYGIYWKSGGG